ncbi:Uncharacterized protein DAT39_012771, partial [Clarias magur]
MITALIDPGSDQNLFSASKIKHLDLPTTTLETLLAVLALDGTPLPAITQKTVPVTLRVS